MDQKLTQEIQSWLAKPLAEHTTDELRRGAMLVLMLSKNRILYDNLCRNLPKHAAGIEYQLKKYAQLRLANITHEQVVQMEQEVAGIVKRNHLDKQPQSPAEKRKQTLEFKKGKRADHDSLLEEVQALYVQNLSILQKMRNLQAKLVILSTEPHTCPDSERFPFLKEMIALDKQYHANWKAYDTYGRNAE